MVWLVWACLAARLALVARQSRHVPARSLRAAVVAAAVETVAATWLLSSGVGGWGLVVGLLAYDAPRWPRLRRPAVAFAVAERLAVAGLLLAGAWAAAWAVWAVARVAEQFPGGLASRPLPAPLADALAPLLRGWGLARVRLGRQPGRQLNARAVGLLGRGRVELSDGLVAALPLDQLRAVLAHEAGHMVHRHREIWLAALVLGGLALFAALPSEGGRLAWVAGLLPVVRFLLRPIPAFMRRRWEYQADAFAAAQVGAPAMQAALDAIHAANGAPDTADRWYQLFFGFHPSPAERRLALCRSSGS
jgi:Zn-dependent protease with chaperone function